VRRFPHCADLADVLMPVQFVRGHREERLAPVGQKPEDVDDLVRVVEIDGDDFATWPGAACRPPTPRSAQRVIDGFRLADTAGSCFCGSLWVRAPAGC
jgi:hypothetical protein